MTKSFRLLLSFTAIIGLIFVIFTYFNTPKSNLPLIAIANYGPHASLQETIDGIIIGLEKLGYKKDQNIRYEISDVNFDSSMIIQMISKFKATKPDIIVAISTPVAQAAKNLIKDIPIIYANVTNPEEAGLISPDKRGNITGASDRQDLFIMLNLALKILPKVKSVGVLYSTSEVNDFSMVEMLKHAASKIGIEVLEIPVEHPRDVIARMMPFNGKVDFIYTGSSATIQTALPAIISTAESMNLAIFNFDDNEVKKHNVLASFGVSHLQIGENVAVIIDKLLKGEKAANIAPIYPQTKDHNAYISKKRAEKISLTIPADLSYVTIVE